MFDTADISPPTPPSGASSPLLPYLNWLSDLELPPQIKNGMMDLHYPESLHHFFLTSERVPVYALWSSDNAAETGIVDATIKSQTEILISILNQYSASSSINLQQSNPDRTNPTIIFIHVTNKSSLEFIPNLATLRQKPNVSFYSFGAHMTINSSQWGFQDIYTEGGILTFTARALLTDPKGIWKQLEWIATHPLWKAYIIPSVLGMAVKIAYRDQDPITAYDSGMFIYDFILTAIDNNNLGFFRTPVMDNRSHTVLDKRTEWLFLRADVLGVKHRDLLKTCIDDFYSSYESQKESDYASILAAEIAQDLKRLETHPGIMPYYRRFVVLQETDQKSTETDLEWVKVDEFDFGDGFKEAIRSPHRHLDDYDEIF